MVVLANNVDFGEDLDTLLLYLDPPLAAWAEADVGADALARYTGAYAEDGGAGHSFVRLEEEVYMRFMGTSVNLK